MDDPSGGGSTDSARLLFSHARDSEARPQSWHHRLTASGLPRSLRTREPRSRGKAFDTGPSVTGRDSERPRDWDYGSAPMFTS